MKIVGLTGPSGAGKSTVSALFRKHGAHTIDGDIVARRVVEKGKPALFEIEKTFGSGVICDDGTLNRAALAKIVFASPDELHKLNVITHKYITEEIKQEIKTTNCSVVVIDAAALIESGIDKMCDCLICVTAKKDVRIMRIMARDNLTEQSARERIDAQPDDEFYISHSDFHIENNSDSGMLSANAEQIIKDVCSA